MIKVWLLSLVFLVSQAPASQRFDVDAENMSGRVIDGKMTWLLEGKAKIVHPDASIHANAIKLQRTNNDITYLEATGSPIKLHYKALKGDYQVFAEKLIYNSVDGIIEIQGKVKLSHALAGNLTQSTIEGHRIKARIDDREIRNLSVVGRQMVAMTHQTADKKNSFKANAKKIIFDPDNNKITLDEVKLNRADEVITAERIEIDPVTGAISSGSQISATLEVKE